MAFQWDPRKARSNLAKHKIAFADAVGALEDPRAITLDDPHPREDRYLTLGLDLLGRLLVVSWTPRDEDIRIISARRATSRERADYEGNG
ncbi:MAG: BrnT family toxin [Myxococcota bacterium]